MTLFDRLSPEKERMLCEGSKLLNKWLHNILESGLNAQHGHVGQLQGLAVRMVDYGMQGIARKLRLLPEKLEDSAHQIEELAMVLGELSLFCRRVDEAGKYNPMEREDLLTFAGIPYQKKNIPNERSLEDRWCSIGFAIEQEERLTIYKHWFYGLKSKTCIFWLEYLFGNGNRPTRYFIGKIYPDLVLFYPSNAPVRVAGVQTKESHTSMGTGLQTMSLSEAVDHFCKLLTLNPFLRSYAYVLKPLKMVFNGDAWCLWDGKTELFPVQNGPEDLPALLSLCDLQNCQFVVECSGRYFYVMSIVVDGQLMSIQQFRNSVPDMENESV